MGCKRKQDTRLVPINYTSREFGSIKNDLVNYAKRYYPETFQDFNEDGLYGRHFIVLLRLPSK